MNLAELRERYVEVLGDLYSKEEIRNFFNWICEQYLGLKPFEVISGVTQGVDPEKLPLFEKALSELQLEKPIQQILGKGYFYGMEFMVNEHTLIPRPETEELVAMIIEDYKSHPTPLRILDIGTGTGCIPISLAKYLKQAELYAIDISQQALAVANENAINNQVVVKFGEIDILKASLLSNLFTKVDQFDVIVSNPPYVRESEKKAMKNNVLNYEPDSALYVSDQNPLMFYEQITKLAAGHLKEKGRLYFEINQYLGPQTRALVLEAGFKEVEVYRDVFKNDRMLRAVL
ncbi:peptide chain release factor N(5)-glutamine methyltransferase [Galbibacter sp.]|jgi:release factor glutamine methyltransferase|uniref:peptide chain release factor N(5)-glutamine methyltransferase n=1 Tax=Galbibacter sp. TaxID=2918471 RepID=UPI003A92A837